MQYPVEPVILIHKLNFAIPELNYLSLIQKIRKEKQAKIERFKFREDALRCLFGELLVKRGMEKYFNLQYEKEIIEEDEFGKPYLKNRQISFNISHSGNWVVVVCFVNNAGIDVEKIENPPYEIMKNTFTQAEIKQIEDGGPQAKARRFYKIWTLKESYIKMLGQGLSVPLASFSIDACDQNNINIKDSSQATSGVYFKLFNPDLEHIIAVCLRNYGKDITPRRISSKDIY